MPIDQAIPIEALYMMGGGMIIVLGYVIMEIWKARNRNDSEES